MQLNGGDDNGGDGDDGGDDGGDGGGDGRDVGDAQTVTEYKKCAQVTMSKHRWRWQRHKGFVPRISIDDASLS